MDMTGLKIGDKFEVRNAEPDGKNTSVILEITQIGKECLHPCRIYYQMGSCIMPQEGIFSRIIRPGRLTVGDMIASV
ncbi:MAG: hypothetical protein KAI62_01900, partial [Actinomycetia bacterium]|nr:hypothetical protein [Actinomycetes bacterium]